MLETITEIILLIKINKIKTDLRRQDQRKENPWTCNFNSLLDVIEKTTILRMVGPMITGDPMTFDRRIGDKI